MMAFDPRLTPARPDLAASHLQGRIVADRYAEGADRVVLDAQAPLRRTPSPDMPLDTEALHGERVTVYEATEEGWAWGQLEADGYVGWLPANALGAPGDPPTHKVAALRTLVFPGPSFKLPAVASLPLGARVRVEHTSGRFATMASGGYVAAVHLVPLAAAEVDFVAVAERFIGTPYLWGGKTSDGIDCSGLVQVALGACGIRCPRDSDMQEREVGAAVEVDAVLRGDLRRGDLVFWKGHVGIMRDAMTLLHANVFHMATALEPIAEAVPRIRPTDGDPIAIRRIAQARGCGV